MSETCIAQETYLDLPHKHAIKLDNEPINSAALILRTNKTYDLAVQLKANKTLQNFFRVL